MLGSSFASPLLTFDSAARSRCVSPDLVTVSHLNINSLAVQSNVNLGAHTFQFSPKKWAIQFTAKIDSTTLSDEDRETWETCREALSAFNFSIEEKDKILRKAFGHVHSPYWGERRKQEVPKFQTVSQTLDYLRSLGLTEDDLHKLLKKFPEILGCSLEYELKTNVNILEEEWGIKGKSLQKLILRNPKSLGYNVDCKGDCMAQCTRCWARF